MFSKILKNKIRILISLIILTIFLGHATMFFRIGFIERLDNLAYDLHLRLVMPQTKSTSVVIVDIDEKSLTAEGRWPWSRNKVSRLVKNLFDEYNISLLGFDIVFAEPDKSSGLDILESLAQAQLKDSVDFVKTLDKIRPDLDFDSILASTIADYPVVLGLYFNTEKNDSAAQKIGLLPNSVMYTADLMSSKDLVLQASGYGSNLSIFSKKALGGGHFSQQPDIDGVVRRQPMLINFNGKVYPSLSLEIVRNALGGSPIVAEFGQSASGYFSLEWLNISGKRIPVDERANTLIPFRGGQGSFHYVSATDILNKTARREILRDKIVLVGTTAPGLFDMRATPVSEVFPGVEVHASLISGMLASETMRSPEYLIGYETGLLLMSGAIMIIAGAFCSPLSTSIFGALIITFIISLSHFGWSEGVILPVASGISMVVIMFTLHMSYGYFVETRGKRLLTGLFGQYIPPELVEEMSESPEQYSLNAESRQLTVLFSDVRGFTSISENLTPQDLSDLMNHFLTPMTAIIHHSRGTIDKYMGDAIMAFWGAPLNDPEHAANAVGSALEMIEVLKIVNSQFELKEWPPLRVGIGIHSGDMSVGNMGSEFRVAYTAMGDNVNLGARIEGLTKVYGVDIICSEQTVDLAPDFIYRKVDKVRVKGKAKSTTLYEPLCKKADITLLINEELRLNDQMLEAYSSQNWEEAHKILKKIESISEKPKKYNVYGARINSLKSIKLEADWNGVYDHETK